MEITNQVFDRIFKRIFSLSDAAIILLINGLFDTDHSPGSSIIYNNRESTNAALEHRFADIFITVAGEYHYHLEAQMTYDKSIVLRAFEYGFYHALETRSDHLSLCFPEPVIVYLSEQENVPEESVIHIHFAGQGTFDYKVKNYVYLRHPLAELNRKKLIVLIPFQVLRLRRLLLDSRKSKIFSPDKFQKLKEIVESDILNSIKANLMVGNITRDDANQLVELTNLLYENIVLYYQKNGGEQMKPLLPGAIELPNDKYRIRIDELETQNSELKGELAALRAQLEELKKKHSSLDNVSSPTA